MLRCVVFIHSYLVHGADEPFNPIASFVQEFLSEGCARIAVPYFFTVSGFFLYRDYEFTLAWFKRKLASRLWSLGIPYVLWAMIGLAFAVVTSMFARKVSFESFQWLSPMWWIRTFGIVEKPLYLGQLWFVHTLLEWLCLAPFVGLLVKKFRFVVPVVCFAVMCIPQIANPWTNALMYISLGACFSLGSSHLRQPSRMQAILLVAAWLGMIAVRAYCVTEHIGSFSAQYNLASILLGLVAVWFGYDLMERRVRLDRLDAITGSAFFIYCSHNIFLAIFRSPLRRTSLWEYDILRYLVPPVLSIVAALMVWKIIMMIQPRFMKLISGGR